MSKIYVGHSSAFDFQNELYQVLRQDQINQQHKIILPHENDNQLFSSKTLFQVGCDLMVAEVSFPSTGLGIELGWADSYKVPIVFLYRKGLTPSDSLKAISQNFLEYEKPTEIPKILLDYLNS